VRSLASAAVVLTALALLPATASAHTGYDRSLPAKSEYLEQSPAAIDIWFTLALSERDNQSLTLTDEQGKAVSKAAVAVDASDPTHVRLPLSGTLPTGRYTVSWRVVAADFMFSEGSYRFYVGVRPTQAQLDDDATLVERTAIHRNADGGSSTALIGAIAGGGAALVLGLGFVFWRSSRRDATD